MKQYMGNQVRRWLAILPLIGLGWADLYAADRFVALGNPDAAPPFTNWFTAAAQLQDAIDAAVPGDTVFVSNGVYQTGGRVAAGSLLTNRVVIDKAITVQSMNGAEVTVIRGAWDPVSTNGNAAVRCVWMTNGATLVGFTLTNGATRTTGDLVSEQSGGGIHAAGTTTVIRSCIVVGNAAAYNGGGVHGGTIHASRMSRNRALGGGGASAGVYLNCVVDHNIAESGGGLYLGRVVNCTVVSNRAALAGGTLDGIVLNAIIYHNSADTFDNYAGGVMSYSCTFPAVTLGGVSTGNITNDPAFVNPDAGDYRLAFTSPCINQGSNSNAVGTVDVFGNPRIWYSVVDMGAHEYTDAPPTGPVHFVVLNHTNAVFPYTSWATASANLQDAADAAESGDTVLVSNGVYNTGGRTFGEYLLTNRVVVPDGVTLQSVNGPSVTVIEGAWDPVSTNGDAAVRGVWLGFFSSLHGFTVTNGATRADGEGSTEQWGGGVVNPASGGTVSNCLITGNAANIAGGGATTLSAYDTAFIGNQSGQFGGGVHDGLHVRCTFAGNSAVYGGGSSADGLFLDCVFSNNTASLQGGGAWDGRLIGSKLVHNVAGQEGGGAYAAQVNDSLVIDNTAARGGGVYAGIVASSTIAANHATIQGGGTFGSDVINAIVYFNTAATDANYAGGTFNYTCTTPLPPGLGMGNLTNDPVFANAAAGDYTLGAGSPSINRGNTPGITATNDLAGNPRIAFFMVDLGAYEYQTASPTGIVHYVRRNHAGWVFPYTSWETAAPTIQMAVDAASAGSTVLVTNGVYNQGGRIAHGGVITNRVVIDKAVRVESVTGPVNTMIHGSGPLGLSAVRGVWMTNGASISGFAISEGHTSSNQFAAGRNGGGLWAQSGSVTISNCLFTANRAFKHGGAVYGGTIHDSSFNLNVAEEGGAAYTSTLWNCSFVENAADYGGAARLSTLYNSFVYQNTASVLGGGLSGGYAENCFILENHADLFGGGIHVGLIVNCTVVGNSAANNYGGSYLGNHRNSILYHNTSPLSPNHADSSSFINTCTYPLPSGAIQCFTNDPQLVSIGSGILSAGSPCRDTGDASLITQMFDRLGNPRVVNGYVDIGAHEFQGAGPGDFDGDGMGNGDEGVAGSDPFDAGDVWAGILPSAAPAPGTITFDSRNGRHYAIDRTEDLIATPQVWTPFTNAIPGTGGNIAITDPDAANAGTGNYRVRVGMAP